MPQVDIRCSQCMSNDYELVNEKTGLVVCRYCRNQWIVPELIQNSAADRFFEEQAERARTIHDNSAETNKQIMDVYSKMPSPKSVFTLAKVIITVIVIVTIISIIVFALMFFNVSNMMVHFFD